MAVTNVANAAGIQNFIHIIRYMICSVRIILMKVKSDFCVCKKTRFYATI